MKLLKFYSPTCAPCRVISPMVDRAAIELQIGVESYDVTQHPDMALEYGIRAVPSLVLVGDGGEHLAAKVGIMTEEALFAWLEEYL